MATASTARRPVDRSDRAQRCGWTTPCAPPQVSREALGRPAAEFAGWTQLPYTWHMNLLDRIMIDPTVRFGKPCVRGTRITVGDLLGHLAGGMSEEQLLTEFPQLSRDDIRACLAYAAERERRTGGVPAA